MTAPRARHDQTEYEGSLARRTKHVSGERIRVTQGPGLGPNARTRLMVLVAISESPIGSVDGKLREELGEDFGSCLHSRQGQSDAVRGESIGVEQPGTIFDAELRGRDLAIAQPSEKTCCEQQRVAVAKQPKILLCDEPTGALDYRTGIAVLEVIENINRELGTSTAVITHNAPVAEMADRVVSLADGRIVGDRLNPNRKSPRELSW